MYNAWCETVVGSVEELQETVARRKKLAGDSPVSQSKNIITHSLHPLRTPTVYVARSGGFLLE